MAPQPVGELRQYRAYGVSIHSDLVLPLVQDRRPAFFQIHVRGHVGPIPASVRQNLELRQNLFSAFDVGFLPEGRDYVGLRDVGEFLISRDGRSITGYRSPQASSEGFDVYLLGQALSFALVKNGIEPLHATALEIGGKAVVFLGDCGFGKSTLAAAFLQAGHRLLTDDLLVLRSAGREILAYSGPQRIKLFPEVARTLLGEACSGVPMNPKTKKLIIPLERSQMCADPIPLGTIYALNLPNKLTCGGVRIRSLSEREAFVTLLRSAFNYAINDAERLRRQFEATQALANTAIVRGLSYPRRLENISTVRDSILADLCAVPELAACKV